MADVTPVRVHTRPPPALRPPTQNVDRAPPPRPQPAAPPPPQAPVQRPARPRAETDVSAAIGTRIDTRA